MSTLFEQLRDEHDKARTLMMIIERTQGDSRGRRELFPKLRSELLDHAAAEERSLYRLCLGSDETQEDAARSIAEHEQIRGLLDELEQRDYSSAQWLIRFRELRDMVECHMAAEEKVMFQLAGQTLSPNQKDQAETTHVEMRVNQ